MRLSTQCSILRRPEATKLLVPPFRHCIENLGISPHTCDNFLFQTSSHIQSSSLAPHRLVPPGPLSLSLSPYLFLLQSANCRTFYLSRTASCRVKTTVLRRNAAPLVVHWQLAVQQNIFSTMTTCSSKLRFLPTIQNMLPPTFSFNTTQLPAAHKALNSVQTASQYMNPLSVGVPSAIYPLY